MKSAETPEVTVTDRATSNARPIPAPEPEVVEQSETTAPAPQRWDPPSRPVPTNLLIIALIVGAIVAILYAWQFPPFGGHYEQTDNAYVRGQTTVISPQVSGYVAVVAVKDFDNVKTGDVLVRIEDRIYNAKVAQARANVLTQISSLNNSTQAQRSKEANELAQDAAIANAEAQLLRARSDMRRLDALISHGWVTPADRDRQVATLRAAEAQLRKPTPLVRSASRTSGRSSWADRDECECRGRQGPGPPRGNRPRPYGDPGAHERPAQRSQRPARPICHFRHAAYVSRPEDVLGDRQLQGGPDPADAHRSTSVVHGRRARGEAP
jgi:hypothetical protein